MTKIKKKVDVMKKVRNFLKVKVMTGRITKYELRTPRELGDIQNLAKNIIFVIKIMFFVNSLISIFKEGTFRHAR